MNEQLTTHSDTKAVTLSAARHDVCLEAAWELDALARVLPDLAHVEGETQLLLVVRGITGRMLRLTDALMAGLNDDAVTDKELRRKVLLEGGSGG